MRREAWATYLPTLPPAQMDRCRQARNFLCRRNSQGWRPRPCSVTCIQQPGHPPTSSPVAASSAALSASARRHARLRGAILASYAMPRGPIVARSVLRLAQGPLGGFAHRSPGRYAALTALRRKCRYVSLQRRRHFVFGPVMRG